MYRKTVKIFWSDATGLKTIQHKKVIGGSDQSLNGRLKTDDDDIKYRFQSSTAEKV